MHNAKCTHTRVYAEEMGCLHIWTNQSLARRGLGYISNSHLAIRMCVEELLQGRLISRGAADFRHWLVFESWGKKYTPTKLTRIIKAAGVANGGSGIRVTVKYSSHVVLGLLEKRTLRSDWRNANFY
jgi:hypothetical protein